MKVLCLDIEGVVHSGEDVQQQLRAWLDDPNATANAVRDAREGRTARTDLDELCNRCLALWRANAASGQELQP